MPTSFAFASIAADATGRNRPARAETEPVDRARDPIVGNRALLAERLEYEMLRHARHERALALFAVEVDREEAVPEVAAALRRALRAQDTVAGVGGRALCVLAPETDRYAATQLGARLRDALPAARVGVALFPHDARAPRELVTRAAAAARSADRRAA
jgi:GGDEF domain-containing protein